MSVLIKDMEMPENCKKCRCSWYDFTRLFCEADGKPWGLEVTEYADRRHPNCPLIEIPCDYDELLKAARAMHTWIFLHSGDENMAYKACGLSDEMNAFLGYSGPYSVTIPADKESCS